MRVLVLGHEGLLGNCVIKLFTLIPDMNVITTDNRWPDKNFIKFIKQGQFDWVINCVAKIPQKKPDDIEYFTINVGLPIFLSSLNTKVIHPSSNLLISKLPYPLSKLACETILKNFVNTYIIRTSIIGIETNSPSSLLSWFLATEEKQIQGFTNQEWNGITTLEWARIALEIIRNKANERLIIPYTNKVSKFELLILFKKIFKKNIEITPINDFHSIVESEEKNLFRGEITSQLNELKLFYKL